jgi:cytochrome c oxidase assembly protein subunit 15
MGVLQARASRVLSPASGFLLFAQAAIVVTGGAVRLTGSGLGCPTWPECTPGSYTPKPYQVEEQVKVWIEFGNRLLTFVLVLAAITVLVSVLAAGRKDLRGLALGQVLGILGQGILGGITVLTGLHPATVAAHFLLSIVLIAGATSLRAQRFASLEKQDAAPLVKKIATAHIVVSFLVLFLGTLVTGSGPHAGDATAARFPFDLRTMAWLHADSVIALFGITFGLFVVHGVSAHTKKRLKIFVAIALSQGLIGYVQWYLDLPELIVGLHLVGSTLVWIAAWRVWLSVTKRMDSK